VHFHRKNIRRKLGLTSDFEMLRYAILVGLSEHPEDASDT
jgi:DNA-binding CsgD family transcriptional regulator